MIKKIKKIKNLGLVFSDYIYSSSLPNFKRYNLIYGWTGSGKTTLSNLFAALEAGGLLKYPQLEYEIEAETGNYKHAQAFDRKVRVFNQDYVSRNIGLLDGKANSIFILGEENQKLIEAIKRDEELLFSRNRYKKELLDNKERFETSKAKQFTDIARIISSNTSGEATRKYDKRNAEDAFIKLQAKELLEEPKVQEYVLTLKQLEKLLIVELEIKRIKDEQKNEEAEFDTILSDILRRGKELCLRTVESVVIERLKTHSDISMWVESGVILHNKHNSIKCEFCGLDLPKSRMEELAQHFSEADKEIKEDIDVLVLYLNRILSCVESANAIDKANLYEELQTLYRNNVEVFEKEKKLVLGKIIKFIELLKEKKSKTTESVVLSAGIDTQLLIKAIEKVNIEIKRHNKKTANFRTEKETAQKELEKYYLSTIYDEVKQSEQKIKDFEKEISNLDNGNPDVIDDVGLSKLEERITKNRGKISSPDKACVEINNKLKSFLSREEIIFEVREEGYLIKRNGEVANDLSEGEKTAIAFVYFVVDLKDQDFDLKNGIVVIDDPISSLDSSMLFRVCSFIEVELKNVFQLFIFTHNYDFLNQMKKWISTLKDRNSNEEFFELFMIENKYDRQTRKRVAEICALDKLLADYESEYHYLFSKLYNFKRDNPVDIATIETIYNYPNMSRKVLECFLAYRIPNNQNFKAKLNQLYDLNNKIDRNELNQIYNFANSHSHLDTKNGLLQFDSTLTLSGKESIELVLKIIEQADEKHFSFMEKSIK